MIKVVDQNGNTISITNNREITCVCINGESVRMVTKAGTKIEMSFSSKTSVRDFVDAIYNANINPHPSNIEIIDSPARWHPKSLSLFDELSKDVKGMGDDQLNTIWEHLGEISWGPEDMYDGDVTMDDWARLVKSEIDKRN